jgi:hypothetical protein
VGGCPTNQVAEAKPQRASLRQRAPRRPDSHGLEGSRKADTRTASSVVFSEARELRALAGIARGHA